MQSSLSMTCLFPGSWHSRGKTIIDLCLQMSNINDIERWSYRISCGVLESKAIKKMLFFKI